MEAVKKKKPKHKMPIIGVTPLIDRARSSMWMLPAYPNGLAVGLMIPMILPLTSDEFEIESVMDVCDGILITGGQDVTPSLYGEEVLPECGEYFDLLDEMEIIIIKKAMERDYPLLGICRGIQILNVALGGTLYQDIPSQVDTKIKHHMEPPYDRVQHEVNIIKDSLLYDRYKQDRIGVNSYHHQAIKHLSPKLEVMAESDDGIIEAVYVPDKKFIWAVQWHPEMWLDNINNQRIFTTFGMNCC